jgi:glycosyltransferase involved in cell wall biosynthesis
LFAIGRLTGVRVALFRHLPDIRRWVTRCVLPRLVDRFFVVSEYARRRLISQGAPTDKLRVLYNPIEIHDLDSARSQRALTRGEFGMSEDDFVVGFVGRVELGKGVRVFWDAVAPLMTQAVQWRLLCVGDGPQLEQWKVAAEKSGLGGRCHFVPWTAHVGRFYSAMDVLVAPSVAPETFCRVIAEAQACQTAVVGTRAGGISEAFAPELSGFLVAPNDRLALRSAIRRLHDDRPLCRRFAESGYEYARINFGAGRIAEDFVADLMESQRPMTKAGCVRCSPY